MKLKATFCLAFFVIVTGHSCNKLNSSSPSPVNMVIVPASAAKPVNNIGAAGYNTLADALIGGNVGN